MDGNTKKKNNFLRNLKNGFLCTGNGFSANITTTLFVTYISFYATDVLGMAPTTIATVLLISKLFDGVTDLIAGFIIDNTHTRFGKARPYDLCIPFVAIFTTLTFAGHWVPQGFRPVFVGIMYTMTQSVFMTLLGASSNVYLLRAFPEDKERTSVFSMMTILGQAVNLVIGLFVPVWVANAGTNAPAWTKMVFFATVPLALMGLMRFVFIKEVVQDEPAKAGNGKRSESSVGVKDGFKAIFANRYLILLTLAVFIIVIAAGLMNTTAAYYFKYFVGDVEKLSVLAVASLASLPMLIIFAPLSGKIGKDKVMKLGLFLALTGNIIRWVGGANIATIGIGLALMMFGVMPISMYFPMYLFDIIDYGEWKTGKRVEGVLAVFPNFANKVAGGLSVSLTGFILGGAGYIGTAEMQTEKALSAVNNCFNVYPTIVLAVMVAIVFFFYDMDKVLPTVKKELEEHKEPKKNI